MADKRAGEVPPVKTKGERHGTASAGAESPPIECQRDVMSLVLDVKPLRRPSSNGSDVLRAR